MPIPTIPGVTFTRETHDPQPIGRMRMCYRLASWQARFNETGQYSIPDLSHPRYYWAVFDPEDDHFWHTIVVSDIPVDPKAPLKTPEWAQCVVYLSRR